MGLTSAEVYTGTGEVLERTASVPDLGPGSLVVSPRERPVVTRAGVSGTAWASVWMPALVKGREAEQVRVAPVSHVPRELLGLIVAGSVLGDGRKVRSRRMTTVCSPTWPIAGRPGLSMTPEARYRPCRPRWTRSASRLDAPPARVARPDRRQRRRRATPGRAQPPRRRPATPGRVGGQSPAGHGDIIVDDQEAKMEMLDQLAGMRSRRPFQGAVEPGARDLTCHCSGRQWVAPARRGAAANRNPLARGAIAAEGIGCGIRPRRRRRCRVFLLAPRRPFQNGGQARFRPKMRGRGSTCGRKVSRPGYSTCVR